MPLYNPYFSSGEYLCGPISYAPSAQASLAVSTTTLAAFSGSASTVAAGSNGGEISTIATWGATFGGNGVLDVANGSLFPAGGGTVTVAASGSTTAVVTYTGVSGNSLTGCAYVSGSATGTVATGGAVTLTSAAASTGSFTAPVSGLVVVTASFVVEVSAAVAFAIGLLSHGGSTPYGEVFQFNDSAASATPRSATLAWLVAVTPGASFAGFDLAGCATSTFTATILAIGQSTTTPVLGTGDRGSAVLMAVQAV